MKRRIAWQIIQVQGPTVYATATVGVATFGATSTVCLTNNVCVALICSTATVVTTDTAVGATNTVGVTVTIGVATIGAAATVTTAATRTPGQLTVGGGDRTGRGQRCGREDRYTLSVADELDTDTVRNGYCAIAGCQYPLMHLTGSGIHKCSGCTSRVHNLCAQDKGFLGPSNEYNLYFTLVCKSSA